MVPRNGDLIRAHTDHEVPARRLKVPRGLGHLRQTTGIHGGAGEPATRASPGSVTPKTAQAKAKANPESTLEHVGGPHA